MPARFKGKVSGKYYSFTEEVSGEVKIKNESDGIDLIKADPTTITDASGVKLSAHADRHKRNTGADPLIDPDVSNLADSGDVSFASADIGTGGTPNRKTVYTPPTNYNNIIPQAIYMEVGGTVATGETITISVKAVLDDGSEYEIASYSVTGATGSTTEATPFANLLTSVRSAGANVNQKRITSVVADVSTSATSTSATATIRMIGLIT